MLRHFFLRPLHPVSLTGTLPQLLRPVRVSTSSELYPDTGCFECLSIQFFNSPAPMLLTGCHATPVVTRCFPPPTQGSRGFPQGWQSFQAYAFAHIHSLIATNIHINIGKAFPCAENFDKEYRAAAKLISSHKNIKQQPHQSATVSSQMIAPSNNTFQNIKALQNCSLKKHMERLFSS